MSSRLAAVLLCTIAACAGSSPPDGGGGGGGGGGSGSGGGGGGGGGDDGGENGGNLSATQYLAGMDKKFCDKAFECKANFPTDAGTTFDEAFGTSPMQCYADAAMYNDPAKVEAAITAGKITYNAADAAACLAGIMFPACATFWTAPPNAPAACGTALVGKVADGAACTVDYECSNLQSYCDETTKKCTVDTMQMRTPAVDVLLHLDPSLRR